MLGVIYFSTPRGFFACVNGTYAVSSPNQYSGGYLEKHWYRLIVTTTPGDLPDCLIYLGRHLESTSHSRRILPQPVEWVFFVSMDENQIYKPWAKLQWIVAQRPLSTHTVPGYI